MSQNLISSILGIFRIEREDARSAQLRANAVISFGLKVISVCAGFLVVSLTLQCLDTQKYGIWLTLTSIVAWFNLFDLGLGNGLRNKLAEAIARHDSDLAKIYVSTGYAVLSTIAGILVLVLLVATPIMNWSVVLNAPPELSAELAMLAVVVGVFFAIRFVTSLITVVLNADQKAWISQAIETLSSIASLICVFAIAKSRTHSLIVFGLGLSLSSALVPLLVSWILFSGKYKWLQPKLSHVRLKYLKDLASLGSKFFLLQIAGILQFSVQNLLISQLIGPSDVAAYNIAFKYFSMVIIFYATVTTPLWSAFTDAFANRDFQWIKHTMKRVSHIWLLVCMVCLLMLIFSPMFFKAWVGNAIRVDFRMSVCVVSFVLLMTWNTSFTLFVNGVGKVRLQIIFAIVAGVMNIPLAYVLVKSFHLGSVGIVLSTVICILPGVVLTPIQYFKLVNQTATGVWNA